jgi:hypothetical protein
MLTDKSDTTHKKQCCGWKLQFPLRTVWEVELGAYRKGYSPNVLRLYSLEIFRNHGECYKKSLLWMGGLLK